MRKYFMVLTVEVMEIENILARSHRPGGVSHTWRAPQMHFRDASFCGCKQCILFCGVGCGRH